MPKFFCPNCMGYVDYNTGLCPYCGNPLNIVSGEGQLPIGTVLSSGSGNSYLFGKLLGGGGFGKTYIAKQLSSDMVVAIKEYYPTRCLPASRDPSLALFPAPGMEDLFRKGMNSFLSEASMLTAINSIPSTVHVFDVFQANNTAYMVMDYLNGKTLETCINMQVHFEPEPLFRKVLPLMRDIDRMHKAGVIHRDIAPDNLLVMPDGSMKLIDFGCARAMEDGKSATVLLKPGFAPIEQYQTLGQGTYTDVYAMAASLYYCITGVVPTPSPDRLSAVLNGAPDPLVPPSVRGVKIDPTLENILMGCLGIQPQTRIQTMQEVANAVAGVVKEDKPAGKPSKDSSQTNIVPENVKPASVVQNTPPVQNKPPVQNTPPVPVQPGVPRMQDDPQQMQRYRRRRQTGRTADAAAPAVYQPEARSYSAFRSSRARDHRNNTFARAEIGASRMPRTGFSLIISQ